MRALVTGASGFIGAHMARRLLDSGHEVVSILHDLTPSSTARLLGIYDRITWCIGDVRDEQLVKRILGDYSIDQVYHFAALPIVEMGMRSCRPMFEVNFMGTLSVLEAMREATVSGKDIGLMFVATDKVYGPVEYGRAYREDDALNANAPYELSKACADMTVRMYKNMDYAKNVIVVRPSNEYGPADLNPRIIPNTIRRCLKGFGPVIYDGVTYTREFTFVEDTIDALMLLTEKGVSGEAYNIGSGEQRDQKGVVSEILKWFPEALPDLQPPQKYSRKEIPYQVLDSPKLRNLGWEPKTNFARGIEGTVAWWGEHPELW
jgi:dTDP-glucose 4,6-dehydratase